MKLSWLGWALAVATVCSAEISNPGENVAEALSQDARERLAEQLKSVKDLLRELGGNEELAENKLDNVLGQYANLQNGGGHSSHSHKHTHAHALDAGLTSVLAGSLKSLFQFGPAVNGGIAVLTITLVTNTLIRVCPALGPTALALLVSFAFGGMLGNIFVHLVPESLSDSKPSSSAVLIAGFLLFCVIDKWLKLSSLGRGSHRHSHTHTHSHSHVPSRPQTRSATEEKARSSARKEQKVKARKPEPETAWGDEDLPETKRGVNFAFLNVGADFAHNIFDGIALAAAFYESRHRGMTAFLLLVLHEVPHQLGDFALLVQGGIPKNAGIQAQLFTSLGTFLGWSALTLVSHFGSLRASELLGTIEDVVKPFTAGVFLFIAVVGILPELLELPGGTGYMQLVGLSVSQLIGTVAGVGATLAIH